MSKQTLHALRRLLKDASRQPWSSQTPLHSWRQLTISDRLVQVDDLLAFSKHTRLRYKAGLPAFVGGQSMGALAALHAVLRDQSAWDGIVLGTATIDVEWTWFLK